MPREKTRSRPKRRHHNGLESARSMARIMVSQGAVGRYAGMFDLVCERLASQPKDRESVELLAQLKSLRRRDAAGDEFDKADPIG